MSLGINSRRPCIPWVAIWGQIKQRTASLKNIRNGSGAGRCCQRHAAEMAVATPSFIKGTGFLNIYSVDDLASVAMSISIGWLMGASGATALPHG